MKFKMVHENYNVADLDKSMRFYEEALGLKERRRKTATSISSSSWAMMSRTLSWNSPG